jgi:hypothetical protein
MTERTASGQFLPGHTKINRHRDSWVVRKDAGTWLKHQREYWRKKSARWRANHREEYNAYMRAYMARRRARSRLDYAGNLYDVGHMTKPKLGLE